MSEWPVKVTTEDVEHRGSPVPAGEPVTIQRVNDHGKQSYIVQCPRCGIMGYCEAGRWEFSGGEEALTARPSILCNSTARTDGPNSRCGGHYWLTDGVLKEV